MTPDAFLGGRVLLHSGNCLDVLAGLAPDSLDACVTDPPYHLGFMGKVWDGGDIAFRPETWAAVYRVLKPGAHLVAMGGTRTYHRLACAIEDAGFEIRDTVSWLYGSGFPKSHDVSKAIDRAAGAEREIVGRRTDRAATPKQDIRGGNLMNGINGAFDGSAITAPATDAAREWQGWNTALKPACELIVLARKPLSEGTVAANVLRWGTGAINVDGCRIGTGEDKGIWPITERRHADVTYTLPPPETDTTNGRWPANVVTDGSDEVVAAFPDARSSGGGGNRANGDSIFPGLGSDGGQSDQYSDSGSAARYFYTAKADAMDRIGSRHPTIKPLDLMQWLLRLVTPPGGTVLDPFAGTGTTGEAAWREGASAVLIEAEPEYQADIRRRMALVLAGPDERQRESIKAKNLPRDDGPLFAARETWAQMWLKPFDFSQEPK